MSNDNDWGPWLQHDGSGCPCVGQMVQAFYRLQDGSEVDPHGPFIAEGDPLSWAWAVVSVMPWDCPIIRYRIRRPKGMAIINAILADLPAPTQPMKTDGVIA